MRHCMGAVVAKCRATKLNHASELVRFSIQKVRVMSWVPHNSFLITHSSCRALPAQRLLSRNPLGVPPALYMRGARHTLRGAAEFVWMLMVGAVGRYFVDFWAPVGCGWSVVPYSTAVRRVAACPSAPPRGCQRPAYPL